MSRLIKSNFDKYEKKAFDILVEEYGESYSDAEEIIKSGEYNLYKDQYDKEWKVTYSQY